MQADAQDLRNGLNMIENELKNHGDPKPGDNFKNKLSVFLAGAKKEMEDVDKRIKRMEDAYKEVVLLFGEDPDKTPPEEFFGIFYQFINAFQVRRLGAFRVTGLSVFLLKKRPQLAGRLPATRY